MGFVLTGVLKAKDFLSTTQFLNLGIKGLWGAECLLALQQIGWGTDIGLAIRII